MPDQAVHAFWNEHERHIGEEVGKAEGRDREPGGCNGDGRQDVGVRRALERRLAAVDECSCDKRRCRDEEGDSARLRRESRRDVEGRLSGSHTEPDESSSPQLPQGSDVAPDEQAQCDRAPERDHRDVAPFERRLHALV